MSIAVVVRKIITGPSTRYSWVTRLPVLGSFAVEAMVSSPFALQELQRVGARGARLPPRRWPGSGA